MREIGIQGIGGIIGEVDALVDHDSKDEQFSLITLSNLFLSFPKLEVKINVTIEEVFVMPVKVIKG